MKDSPAKIFEFRIKYNAEKEHSALNNYHYYNAFTPEEALSFHMAMLKKNNLTMQTLSVEKFNPYSKEWEDCSNVLSNQS